MKNNLDMFFKTLIHACLLRCNALYRPLEDRHQNKDLCTEIFNSIFIIEKTEKEQYLHN